MSIVDKRIIEFINEHHVLTIATSIDNKPYCANCFYVYSEKDNKLIFTSDIDTKHGSDFLINPYVAGSIVLETKTIGKIQGIQFNGIIQKLKDKELKEAKKLYLNNFPYAVIMKTTLWAVELDFIKMTHNILGFGKKLIWQKDE